MANVQEITAIYKTDFHHSFSSRDLIGLFTNDRELKKILKKMINDDIDTDHDGRSDTKIREYKKWLFDFLIEKNQTQGLNSFEIVLEQLPVNQAF